MEKPVERVRHRTEAFCGGPGTARHETDREPKPRLSAALYGMGFPPVLVALPRTKLRLAAALHSPLKTRRALSSPSVGNGCRCTGPGSVESKVTSNTEKRHPAKLDYKLVGRVEARQRARGVSRRRLNMHDLRGGAAPRLSNPESRYDI